MTDDIVASVVRQWQAVNPGLDTGPMEIIGRINRCAALLQQAEDAPLRSAGLTRAEFDLLGAVRRTDRELTPGELARETFSSGAAVTKRLRALQDRALVERRGTTATGGSPMSGSPTRAGPWSTGSCPNSSPTNARCSPVSTRVRATNSVPGWVSCSSSWRADWARPGADPAARRRVFVGASARRFCASLARRSGICTFRSGSITCAVGLLCEVRSACTWVICPRGVR